MEKGWLETLGIGRGWSFLEQVGILRQMLQALEYGYPATQASRYGFPLKNLALVR